MSMILSQSSAPAPAPTLSNLTSASSELKNLNKLLIQFNLFRMNLLFPGVHSNSNVMSNSNAAIENHMNNNTSSSLSNCVSPTSNQSVAVSSSRTSPSSLMSPQQQQQHQQNILNGPSSQKQAPTTVNAVSHPSSDPSSESMSTLKTIAQEVVNRNNVNLVQTPPIMTQQQQQQNQFVMDSTSIDPSSTANINSLISATSASSTAKTGTNEALIPPLLGVAPLGPSPLQKDHQQQVI